MATENPTWGYTRIRGGLKRVGHDGIAIPTRASPKQSWIGLRRTDE